ncbi:DNA-binding response regulator [Actinosynnema sp. ALI-1.44]|uniref:response regulator transcription factor n=1 Tax=Actinosynnema sp. ALI-1.44 TaxID=1933779 RepID=UPI00097BB9D7|nr:response regulator transcription factor [Actinosynnema sp. ALI-1.44]ONI91011.1 DNA-binding response regulator [Actinosynnema sp. ALI-1.44]
MRVVIAEDSALLREGLARLLTEAGVTVCALTGDATTLAEAVDEHQPDVAMVDIRMPPTYTHEGAAAAIELKDRHPGLGVLLLSQAIETHFASQLLTQHAERFGYLLKDRVIDVPTLLGALRTIAAGGTILDPHVMRHLMRTHAQRNPVLSLTERERDVLTVMAEGRSNAAIAERLVVNLRTVESHIANIFTKLGLHDTPNDHRRVLAVLAALREEP